VFDTRSWDLQELKQIRALERGSTVNDVVLAVIAGALRSYLLAHDELPESSLRAVVPVSVRSENGNRVAASADGQSAGSAQISGNEIVTMAVRLHTEEPDDVARFSAICASTKESKVRKQAIGARALTDLAATLPGRLLGLGFRAGTLVTMAAGTQPLFNTMVTNVPGSPVPLYFCGARALDVYGLGPLQDAMGLMHIVGSYDGKIGIFITADRAMLPDIDAYMDYVEKAYRVLLKAAVRRSAVKLNQESD
jgi:WS/DGAT/MGAT family acyltransferase